MPSRADEMYTAIEGDFYEKQKRSTNPLRRWFHMNRYRIVNSLVKGKYHRGMRIIDVGCGSCDWNVNGLDILGVDVNEELLKTGIEKKRLSEYLVAEASQTGLPTGSVDIITAFEFLEHLDYPQEAVREMYRLLREGGYAIVSVPYDVWASLWRPLFMMQVFLQGYIFRDAYYRRCCGHVQHFSPLSLATIFKNVGFRIELLFHMRRMTMFLVARKGAAEDPPLPCPDLTVILPTLNEEKNLGEMLEFLTFHYPQVHIVVADDGSVDATKPVALSFADRNVAFLDRSAKEVHGLTASVLDAINQVETKYFVVIDADSQHPPAKIGEIVNILRLGSKVVVGSRVEVCEKWPLKRKVQSYAGTALGKISLLIRGKSYLSYDILSGFFGVETRFFRCLIEGKDSAVVFKLRGYKFMFDMLKLLPSREEIEEVYFKFGARQGGASKINFRVNLEYLKAVFK